MDKQAIVGFNEICYFANPNSGLLYLGCLQQLNVFLEG
jgi:hypothetical protein